MIVGLTGKKGSGKDTVGTYLVEQHGFARVSFAAPLKESVAGLFGITLEQIESWKNNPHACVVVGLKVEDGWVVGQELTFRQLLQRYGTEAARDVFGDDFWIDIARRRIAELHSDGFENIVITDVRFDNEAELIRDLGGSIVRVYRPKAEHGNDSHASEQLPQADYALVNTGTFAYLYDQARRYIVNGETIGRSDVTSDPWAGTCGFPS